jgi:hypothetical protein
MTVPHAPSAFVPEQPDFTVHPLDFDVEQEYDILVATVGFETRSAYLLSKVGPNAGQLLVSAYNTRKSEQFYVNLEIALALGAVPEMESDDEFASRFGARLQEAVGASETPLRMAVDVSSCSRMRLAAMLREISRLQDRLVVDYLYVPGRFRSPTQESRALAVSGPVLKEFGGLVGPSASRITALLGLGFEDVEALGAYQLLEPSDVWLFVPRDMTGEYVQEVLVRNDTLLGLVDPGHALFYDVHAPATLFNLVESAVYGARVDTRPVLVPLGPKIFALICLLVSLRYNNEIPVWRFSSDQFGPVRDVAPSDKIIGLQVCHRDATSDSTMRAD